MKREGVRFVIHCLDDFLLIGAPDSHECEEALHVLLRICSRLGFPVAMNKLEGPGSHGSTSREDIFAEDVRTTWSGS